jgi:hypothetical protein
LVRQLDDLVLFFEAHEGVIELGDAGANGLELATQVVVSLDRFELLQTVDMLHEHLDQGVDQCFSLARFRPIHDDLDDLGVLGVLDQDRA